MLELRKLNENNVEELYSIIYAKKEPEWAKYNAPYFNDYEYIDLETFKLKNNHSFYLTERVRGIFIDEKLIGIVTKHWECFITRWLEVGIIIFDENFWSKGIGKIALKIWLEDCFLTHPEIARLGLTTWSGNKRMMKLAEKLELKKEAHLRKVRYYNGIYYDCIKYGILREEFFQDKNINKVI